MAVSVLIPPFTIPSGDTVLGPVTAPANWHIVTITLDVASLVAALDLVLEWSLDSLVWHPLAAVTGLTGPSLDIHGVLQTSALFRVTFGDANAGAQIRATATNHGLPVLTAGGSLQAA